MDTKHERMRLIRERHRKLILEPRRRIEYALLDDFEEEPLFDDEELASSFAKADESTKES
jgi:hypothetical protein